MAVFGAPPIDGLGSTGGFKLQVQDRAALGLRGPGRRRGQRSPRKGNSQPGLVGLFSSFSANQPQLYVDVDRVKAKTHGVSLNDVFDTLGVYLGSAYVNDFTLFDRNWQVNVQADPDVPPADPRRGQPQGPQRAGQHGARWRRSIKDEPMTGPAIVNHYNMYPSAEINGATDARHQLRPGHPHHGTRSPSSELPSAHGLRVDRADLPADRGGQGPAQPSSSSRWRCCSSSWCWRPSTKAGRCRWRSS